MIQRARVRVPAGDRERERERDRQTDRQYSSNAFQVLDLLLQCNQQLSVNASRFLWFRMFWHLVILLLHGLFA